MGGLKKFFSRHFDFVKLNRILIKNNVGDNEFFPAVFACAEEESGKAQKNHFLVIGVYYFSLLLASGLAGFAGASSLCISIAAILIIISIICSVYIRYSSLEDQWYRCRAVSESIKTSVWHFVMRSEPYDEPDDNSERELRSRIDEILSEHGEHIPPTLSVVSTEIVATEKMRMARSMAWQDKLSYYIIARVDDQLEWYSCKSKKNEEAAQIWFERLFACQLLACGFAVLRIPYPSTNWPIGLALIGAGAISAWTQAKKFNELSSAYAVTVSDIRDLKKEAQYVDSEDALAKYVSDSENAFSREHTQWLARKDSP